MEDNHLPILAQIVLPSQMLEYFTIAGIEQTASEIRVSLDEKMRPELFALIVHYVGKRYKYRRFRRLLK